MLAESFLSDIALLDETDYFSFAVAVFLLPYLQVNNVAGHAEGYEDHHVVYPRQGFSFGGAIGDGHIFQYG